ncbi:hypothetical protein [Alkalibacter saccharofermentans]|uniref:Uncharacterized protein n=1 Tax=Alkalibacter saccharofermentans DSM 14828 TaxID=1120975 RepID=A0A1M4XE58_9FIRM|nr:hypothetical protein [Alkalibacter saccharofermentans]SHE91620.1 hypothetical protein SAMN02746064_01485 [Alkalibacter saccharofermentans DSM 14828]
MKIKKRSAVLIIAVLALGLLLVFMPMMSDPFVSMSFKGMIVFSSILLVAVFAKVLVFSFLKTEDKTGNDEASGF